MSCPKGCGACSQNGLCSTCLPGWIKNKKGRCIAKGSDNCDECELLYLMGYGLPGPVRGRVGGTGDEHGNQTSKSSAEWGWCTTGPGKAAMEGGGGQFKINECSHTLLPLCTPIPPSTLHSLTHSSDGDGATNGLGCLS